MRAQCWEAGEDDYHENAFRSDEAFVAKVQSKRQRALEADCAQGRNRDTIADVKTLRIQYPGHASDVTLVNFAETISDVTRLHDSANENIRESWTCY